MLLTILAVHTTRAAVVRASVSIGGVGAAVTAARDGVGVGMLAWEEKLPLLLIGFCIHFLNFRAYADGGRILITMFVCQN